VLRLAAARAPAPRTRRLLVVCGSYVPATTRQLNLLLARFPHSLVEVDVHALASGEPAPEVVHAAKTRLNDVGLAVVATQRERVSVSLAQGEQIAHNLALVARDVDAGVVIAKGGITSAVTARVGLGARTAICRGPLVDGVALWHAGRVPYVVFPGNVGTDDTLREVVEMILEQ
jgi:uncharacterized protein YgbK (DUF1537 family)